MNKAYSTNDEEYDFYDVAGVLDALDSQGRLIEGTVYYECDTQPVCLADYISADLILECAEEQAYDDLGDSAADAFTITTGAAKELSELLRGWAQKHLSDRAYWKCVGESRELMVTADDVAELARARQ